MDFPDHPFWGTPIYGNPHFVVAYPRSVRWFLLKVECAQSTAKLLVDAECINRSLSVVVVGQIELEELTL